MGWEKVERENGRQEYRYPRRGGFNFEVFVEYPVTGWWCHLYAGHPNAGMKLYLARLGDPLNPKDAQRKALECVAEYFRSVAGGFDDAAGAEALDAEPRAPIVGPRIYVCTVRPNHDNGTPFVRATIAYTAGEAENQIASNTVDVASVNAARPPRTTEDWDAVADDVARADIELTTLRLAAGPLCVPLAKALERNGRVDLADAVRDGVA